MGTNDVRLFDALDDGRDRDFALPEAWTVLDEEADDADDADELDADVDFERVTSEGAEEDSGSEGLDDDARTIDGLRNRVCRAVGC